MFVDIPLQLVLERMADDPFETLDVPNDNAFFDKFEPARRYWDESARDFADNRVEEYDAPRIRFFRDKLRNDERVEAIRLKMDSKGRLHMGNGYHRLVAAILAGRTEIRVQLVSMRYDVVECMHQIDNLRRELRTRKAA